MNHIHNVLKHAFAVLQVGENFRSFAEYFRRGDLKYHGEICYEILSTKPFDCCLLYGWIHHNLIYAESA